MNKRRDGGGRASERKPPPLWAFSDETERADTMIFGTLLVPTSRLAVARQQMEQLLLPGQRRVHTAKESPRRRRALLDVVSELDVKVLAVAIRRPVGMNRVRARALLIEETAGILARREVRSWRLDYQAGVQAARDRHTIDGVLHRTGVDLTYDHQTSAHEPLLWAVDAVVWAIGAGGDWRRRVDHLVDSRRVGP